MQGELESEGIRILGVNEAGQESGNAVIVQGRSIPWLQETSGDDVWSEWKVTYRDVIVLNRENEVAGVFNLTERDLGKPAEYEALKTMLLEEAQE